MTKEKKSTDLGNFDTVKAAEEGAGIALRHPVSGEVIMGDDEKPVEIFVVGRDSAVFRNTLRRSIERRMKNTQQKGRNAQRNLSLDETEDEAINLLAACTTGWTNNFKLDGAKFEYTSENAVSLYRRFPAFREQVDEGIADRANFLKG